MADEDREKFTVGYVRVNAYEQKRSGLSITAQTRAIRSYCVFNKLPLKRILVDYCSAKDMARPEFKKIVQLVKSNWVDNFIVYRLDRMAKNTKGAIEFMDLMNEYGVDFHSVSEKIDTGSPQGKLFFTIISAFAQMERELASERIKEAMEIKKEKGEWISRAPKDHMIVDKKLVALDTPHVRKLYEGLELVRAGMPCYRAEDKFGFYRNELLRFIRRYEKLNGVVMVRRKYTKKVKP